MLTDAALAALKKSAEFTFFPPIQGIDGNAWKFLGASRIEFSAVNQANGETIWFPRSSVAYCTVEEQGITLALSRQLRYAGGAVWPVRSEMGSAAPEEAAGEAIAARTAVDDELAELAETPAADEHPPPHAVRRNASFFSEPLGLVLAAVGGGAVVLILALVVARAWLQPSRGSDSAPISDSSLFTLQAEDNYHDVVRKLGPPESERVLTAPASSFEERALVYGKRDYAVVLLSVQDSHDPQQGRYIGAVRLSDGAVVSAVTIDHNNSTEALLKIAARQLKAP